MLRLRLFGELTAELSGVPVGPPSSRAAWSLLGWLALNPGRHPRADVAALFWPDVLDSSARASLRSAVWSLRSALGSGGHLLETGREHVGLAAGAGVWADVHEFRQLVAAGLLARAAALTDGQLLTGMDYPWVLEARDVHRADLSAVLEQLAAGAQDDGDLAGATALTRRQVMLDPIAEEPVTRLMGRLAAGGDRAAALTVYGRFAARLERELGIAPSAATRRRARDLSEGPAPQPAPSHPERRGAPLAGRGQELATLLAAWRAACGGAGSVITISGEPGIGKTRLATEILDRARAGGARAASSQAVDLGAGAPLGLWAELIGDLSHDLDAPPLDAAWPSVLAPLAPDLEHRLGRRPRPAAAAAPELERARLYEATVSLLQWAARRPLVLLLDDLHAADPASLELAAYVGRRLAALPVLMIMTRRQLPRRGDVDAMEHALRARRVLSGELVLGPLPGTDIDRLARAAAALSDTQAGEIVTSAGGNPLIAVEWARAIGRGEREPPASLRGAVRGALAPLAAGPVLLAQLAAVAGRELSRRELDALPLADPAGAAAAALDSGLFTASRDRFSYRHALLREAAYSDLAEPARSALHAIVATALAGRTDLDAPRFAAEAATHFRRAGRDDLAVVQLTRAATHARGIATLPAAAAFLVEASHLAPDDAELQLDLAEVAAWRGQRAACEEAFGRAVALLGPRSAEQLALAWARRVNWFRGPICHPGQVRVSVQHALAALDSAGLTRAALRAELLAEWAWAEAVDGDLDACDRLLVQVHGLHSDSASGDDDLVVHSVGHARGFSLIRRGQFTDSYAPLIAAGEAARRASRPDLSYGAWANAASAAACAGEFVRALEFIDRGMAATAGSGLSTLDLSYQAARASILVRLGRIPEAVAAAGLTRELSERLGVPELIASSEHIRGLVALASGDWVGAARLLAAALEHGMPGSRSLARLELAEALITAGRCDDAEAQLRATAAEPVRASDMPETLVPRLTRLQGLIAVRRGDSKLAARRLNEAAAGWRRLLGQARAGNSYTAVLADFGRPPGAGLVEPERELQQVLNDLSRVLETRSMTGRS
jgi:DNA-binding SARP family transcriptional activator/tetratricopeptide (TPR) repeat protein